MNVGHIHWYGHDSFRIEDGAMQVYIDPWKMPEGLPRADVILITHSHYDHYSAGDVGRPAREHALHWPHVHRETTAGAIRLPEGFAVHSMPEAVSFDSPAAAYTASIAARDGAIAFEDQYDLKVDDAPRDFYADYKAGKELRANLARQRIILMKWKGDG